jgi:hypothetical protein
MPTDHAQELHARLTTLGKVPDRMNARHRAIYGRNRYGKGWKAIIEQEADNGK